MRSLVIMLGLLISVSSFAAPVVVLIPGAGSSGEKLALDGMDWLGPLIGGNQYFGRFKRDLKKAGIPHITCPRAEDGDSRSLEERRDDCVDQIILDRGSCSGKVPRDVVLVGHSMGGLIARMLAQDPRVEPCIHSVTMISTPNRGTPLADWAIEHARNDHGIDILGMIVNLIKFEPTHRHYIQELATHRDGVDPAVFRAQDTPDNPAVAYYSITNSMEKIPQPILSVSRKIIASEMVKRGLDQTPYGTKNDGIVAEYSMPHGTVIGHLESYHWTTACVDPVRRTKECKIAAKALYEHLAAIMP